MELGKIVPCVDDQENVRWYVIQPVCELPYINVDRSMTEVFPSFMVPPINRFARTNGPLLGYIIWTLLYIPAVMVPGVVGKCIAIITFLGIIPAFTIGLAYLRYDVVKLLLTTFDIRFITVIALMTHSLFFIVVKSIGGCLIGFSFIGYEINAFTDANPVSGRTLEIVDAILAFSSVCGILPLMLNLVPETYDFNLITYRTRYISAMALIRFGYITTCTVLLRNAYRKYRRLGTDVHNIVCVSYRCTLQFQPVHKAHERVASNKIQSIRHESSRQMRYIPIVPTIDATHTVNSRLFRRKNDPALWTMPRYSWPHKLGAMAAFFSVAIGTVDFIQYLNCPHCRSDDGMNACRLISLFLTTTYVGCCVMVQQRQLLFAICTSFDFVFLAVQIVFVHGAIIACYRGDSWVVVRTLTSLLWCYWVLTVDAITPIMRRLVGIDQSRTIIVCIGLVVLELVAIYLLIFDPLADQLSDLVLWKNNSAEVCLLSAFYGTFTTVSVWSLRTLARIWTANTNDLIMLDGPVQYYSFPKSKRHIVNNTPQSETKENVQSCPKTDIHTKVILTPIGFDNISLPDHSTFILPIGKSNPHST